MSFRCKRMNFLSTIISFDSFIGGFVQGFFSWGMVALAYTMHGLFHDYLSHELQSIETTVAIIAIRIFAMYHRSKNMRIFLIISFMAFSASRGVLDGLALSPTSLTCKLADFLVIPIRSRIATHVQQKNIYFPARESVFCWRLPLCPLCPTLTAFQVYLLS